MLVACAFRENGEWSVSYTHCCDMEKVSDTMWEIREAHKGKVAFATYGRVANGEYSLVSDSVGDSYSFPETLFFGF